MASGHVNRIKRPNTWLHRPMLQNVKKGLANPEPSTHGTKPTWPAWSAMSGLWGYNGSRISGPSAHALAGLQLGSLGSGTTDFYHLSPFPSFTGNEDGELGGGSWKRRSA